MTTTKSDSNADGIEGKTQTRLTIVASDKSISVVSPLGPVDDLVRLFERNVHVSVDGLQLACQNSQSECVQVRFMGGLRGRYPCRRRPS